MRRDYLAFTLWPDSTEEQARADLRQALFGLTLLKPLAAALHATRALKGPIASSEPSNLITASGAIAASACLT